MSILSIVQSVVDAHSVLGAVAGSVVTVSSQAIYKFVAKQTASAKAAVVVEVAKVESAVKAKV